MEIAALTVVYMLAFATGMRECQSIAHAGSGSEADQSGSYAVGAWLADATHYVQRQFCRCPGMQIQKAS